MTMQQTTPQGTTTTTVLTAKKLKRPPKYDVIIYNDDVTPAEFVVRVLVLIFGYDGEAAVKLMLAIHETGEGVVGTYSKEIAETKVDETNAKSREEGENLKIEAVPQKDSDA